MKFKLEINLDNAAFDGDDLPLELASILHNLATGIENNANTREELLLTLFAHRNVHDLNGNTIGTMVIV